MVELVVFELGQRRYALPAHGVRRVLPALDVAPLPAAPPVVAGLVNLHGSPVPVIDLRHRLGLPPRPPALTDRLIVADTGRRTVALQAEAAVALQRVPAADVLRPEAFGAEDAGLTGVVCLPDGLLFIHDLEALLSGAEETAVAAALASRPRSAGAAAS